MRPFLIPWFVLVLFSVALFEQPAVSAPNPPPANRFLFIVDTSDAAPNQFDATLKGVQDLVDSGIGGQAHEGDSLGLWTFNQATASSHFPLQRWSGREQSVISTRMTSFLRTQKPEKRTGIDGVLPAMSRLISNSPYITVLLFSDGAEELHGTPFDEAINAAYKKWRKEQRKERKPFATVLRAKDGQFTGYSVTPLPWAVELPPLPAELSAPYSSTNTLAANLHGTNIPGAGPISSDDSPRKVTSAPGSASLDNGTNPISPQQMSGDSSAETHPSVSQSTPTVQQTATMPSAEQNLTMSSATGTSKPSLADAPPRAAASAVPSAPASPRISAESPTPRPLSRTKAFWVALLGAAGLGLISFLCAARETATTPV